MNATVNPSRNFSIDEQHAALRLQAMATAMTRRYGAWMRKRRKELGLTQKQVAERMKKHVGDDVDLAVDAQRVSDWERGYNKPSERYEQLLIPALEVEDASYFYQEPEDLATPDLSGALTAGGEQAQLDQIQADLAELRRQQAQLVGILTGDPEATAILGDALVRVMEKALAQRAKEVGLRPRRRPQRPRQEGEKPAA